MNICDRHRIL